MSSVQPTNYLFRVGDASHLWTSSEFNIWGIHSTTSGSKFFLKNVNPGDVLWFVKGKSKGLIVATAIYEHSTKRLNGECMSFEELGWTNVSGNWDTDIHFKNFKKIEHMGLLSQIKGSAANPRVYNSKCLVNLPEMCSQIYPTVELVQSMDVNVRKELFEDTNYLITTNGDLQDEQIKKFAAALICFSKNNEAEDEDEAEAEAEKVALEKILDTCSKINGEITQLISLLNTRLAKL